MADDMLMMYPDGTLLDVITCRPSTLPPVPCDIGKVWHAQCRVDRGNGRGQDRLHNHGKIIGRDIVDLIMRQDLPHVVDDRGRIRSRGRIGIGTIEDAGRADVGNGCVGGQELLVDELRNSLCEGIACQNFRIGITEAGQLIGDADDQRAFGKGHASHVSKPAHQPVLRGPPRPIPP